MKTIDIKVQERKELGKKATKSLRKDDFIPCVMYGGEKLFHFTAHENDFRHLIYTPYVFIVNLTIGRKKSKAILKDIQFHPVTDKILSIDFYEINENEKTIIAIPVHTEGFAKGVQDGGKLQLIHRKLRVRGLINDLPDEIMIDITDVELGQSLKIKDLKIKGLEIVEPANTVILSVKLTRVARSEDEDEEGEGEEGEEGAEGTEGAEGKEGVEGKEGAKGKDSKTKE